MNWKNPLRLVNYGLHTYIILRTINIVGLRSLLCRWLSKPVMQDRAWAEGVRPPLGALTLVLLIIVAADLCRSDADLRRSDDS